MALSNEQWNAPSGGGDFYEHQIANSVRTHFGDNNSSIKRTPGTGGNRATWSISIWMKRAHLGANQMIFESGASGNFDTRLFYQFKPSGGIEMSSGEVNYGTTSQLFRDPSAWYHIFIKNASNSNTLYVNGTLYNTQTLSGNTAVNKASEVHGLGTRGGSGNAERFGGYIAEFLLFDGTAYDPTDVAEDKNGVWIPKDPSELTLNGENTTWLKFANSAALGTDSSGEGNTWTIGSAIAAHDQMLDSPTFTSDGGHGNFCTLNPVYSGTAIAADATRRGALSQGNLKHSFSGGQDGACPGTIKTPASGKWYFEYAIIAGGGTGDYSPGAGIIDPEVYTNNTPGYNAVGAVQYSNNLNKVYKGSSVVGTYSGSRGSNGDVMGIAVDMDNGAFYVSKNGTYQTIDGGAVGDPTSGASRTGAGATWTPASEFTNGMVPLSAPNGGNVPIINLNFGQDGTFQGTETAGGNADANDFGNFFTAPPTDYLAVCTGNLTVATEIDPAQTNDNFPQKLFSPILYTGTDADINVPVGFKPDWVWLKNRAATYNHYLFDSTRGVTKILRADTNAAEATTAESLKAFISTGFTYGDDATGNEGSATMVSWNWRANGGSLTANDDGNATSNTQTDPSGAFSIVKYTGTANALTVGHGLSVEPKLTLVKDRDAAVDWVAYTKVVDGSLDYFLLNTTAAKGNSGLTGPNASIWNFQVESGYSNTANRKYIMYNFVNVEGYCKVGRYEGNGAADGTMVYTGFSPAFVILKSADSTSDWQIFDNKREGYNVDNDALIANDTTVEATADNIDLLSNGFKFRVTTDPNVAETYVYLAFAHNPFKYASAR